MNEKPNRDSALVADLSAFARNYRRTKRIARPYCLCVAVVSRVAKRVVGLHDTFVAAFAKGWELGFSMTDDERRVAAAIGAEYEDARRVATVETSAQPSCHRRLLVDA